MKTIIILIVFVFCLQKGFSQIVISSCEAPDSVKSLYREDADRLTLRRIISNNLVFVDSVEIPQAMSDTVLRSLVAIYNASTLPASDTVTTLLNIHTLRYPFLNEFYVAADSNLAWMQQFHQGMSLSGNVIVDSLMQKYNMHVYHYYDWTAFSYHVVSFRTDSNYNAYALSAKFELISGVMYSEPDGNGGDGSNITDSLHNDHLEIIFSYGWGDCMSGCMMRRFWKFNVYFDCSVEFVGSYGSILNMFSINEIENNKVSIIPNPFVNYLETNLQSGKYSIFDMAGKELKNGEIINGKINSLENLQAGMFILTLYSEKLTYHTKLIKKSSW